MAGDEALLITSVAVISGLISAEQEELKIKKSAKDCWTIFHKLRSVHDPKWSPTPNDPRPQLIPKIDLNTTRNDPRLQMIPKFFHTRPEMIPEEL